MAVGGVAERLVEARERSLVERLEEFLGRFSPTAISVRRSSGLRRIIIVGTRPAKCAAPSTSPTPTTNAITTATIAIT
jgi:hypothetical protein